MKHSDITSSTVAYYDTHAAEYVANTVDLDLSALYKPFLALIPAGGRVLDAGCGSGRDGLYFKRNGFDVTAFDASSEMVRAGSELLGQPVLNLTFQELDFRNEFDGIWACA